MRNRWIATTWSSGILETLSLFRHSRGFRASAKNAAYSAAEYASQPLTMLLAAPFLLHRLGLQQFGIWMLAMAIINSVGNVTMGFGDGTIRYVSGYRGKNDAEGAALIVRGALTINSVLGGLLALAIWFLAPIAASHVFRIEPQFQGATVHVFQVSGLVLLFRSVNSVFMSALRAFEHYAPSVKVMVIVRALTICSAVVLVSTGRGVVAILLGTLVCTILGIILQAYALSKLVPGIPYVPTLRKEPIKEIVSFGCFSWAQALASTAFAHADRLLVGAFLGTEAVAYYSICVQAAQPVHELTAATFNFIFPHLNSRYQAGETTGPGRVLRLALLANFALVACLCLPLLIFSRTVLTLWMGAPFAQHANALLEMLVGAFGLLGLSVVPHFTLLALGEVKFVALVNVVGGVLTLVAALILIPTWGLPGAAAARFVYGLVVATSFMRIQQVIPLATVEAG